MIRRSFLLFIFLVFPIQSAAGDLELLPGVAVRFASVREGQRVLSSRDDYAKSLNGFNAAVRMRTTKRVSADDYLRFAARHVRPWSAAEKKLVATVIAEARPELARFRLPLPRTVLLVKTDGREEADAPYTRLNAVILTSKVLAEKRDQLKRIFVHELFHVLTRHNEALRDDLYGVIGFRRCDVRLPRELGRLKMSNPDHPRYLHSLEIPVDGRKTEVVPVIVSKHPEFDPEIPGDFFSYMRFCLLVVRRLDGTCVSPEPEGKEVLLDPKSVPGYREHVGWNTDYINSPEEVLADNFALMVLGDGEVRSPQVIDGMRAVLQESAHGS